VKILAFFLVIFSLNGCSSSPRFAPVSDVAKQTKPYQPPTTSAKRDTSEITSKTYRIQKNDTLFAIAWRSSLDVNQLALYNRLTAPYLIREGQTLRLTAPPKMDTPYMEKSIIKNEHLSQKKQLNNSKTCKDQSCNKNSKKVVVQEKVKVYSKIKSNLDEDVSKPQSAIVKVSRWRWPTKGTLTKTFAVSQTGMKGISLANKRGTSIYTTASGEVVYAGSGLRGFGNLIIIKHNDDYLSAYAHNEQLLVREKQQVKAGQKIATMGDSGTDSVKLHFEIRYQGKSVDPLRYLPKRY